MNTKNMDTIIVIINFNCTGESLQNTNVFPYKHYPDYHLIKFLINLETEHGREVYFSVQVNSMMSTFSCLEI